MYLPRVRISTLIGLVLASALGLAALRRPSPEVEQAVFSATVVALILAALRAVHRSGAARAFWSGFALAGGTYLALSIIPATEGRLATTRAVDIIAKYIEEATPAADSSKPIYGGKSPFIIMKIPNKSSLVREYHDLFAWIFGATAGMIARAWWAGRRHGHDQVH